MAVRLTLLAAMGLSTSMAVTSAPVVAQGLFDDDVIEVEVLPGWREAGMAHIAALRFTLDPGWKTYWRAPGDAGIPPYFDWQGSQNLVSVTPHFPVPDIFDQNGMRSIGYENEVVIPLHLERRSAAEPIYLQGMLQIGVCEEICIPAMLEIEAMLPPQGGADSAIQAALADRPMTEAEGRVGRVTCAVDAIADGLALTMTATMPPLSGAEAAAIETADPSVWVAEPSLNRSGNTLVARTELVHVSQAPFALDRSGVRMTVFGDSEAVEIVGCAAR
ncbi:MAG: protein-disulfide reductase DsbD domain-containing protein [Pseudomonadota bacterium]